MDYESATRELEIPSLEARSATLCQNFFDKILDPNNKLFRMFPLIKGNVRNTKLRNGAKYPLPITHTNWFKKLFLPFALYKTSVMVVSVMDGIYSNKFCCSYDLTNKMFVQIGAIVVLSLFPS